MYAKDLRYQARQVLAGNGPVRACAITSGGSQAMFFKVNTWGEESFLDTLNSVL